MRSSLLLIIVSFSYLYTSAQQFAVSNDSVAYCRMMFTGDLLVSKQMTEDLHDTSTGEYHYEKVFRYVQPILNLGDIVCGNLEMTLGTEPYGMFPTYHVPKEFGIAMKYAGYNLVMNANSKAVYLEEEEWYMHQSLLRELGLQQIGAFDSEDDKIRRSPVVIEKNGVKTAFINAMAGIDYVPEVSPFVNPALEDNINAGVLAARSKGADFVVVYLNWGKQYQNHANAQQQQFAQFCAEAGADLIIGTHPHVVQELIEFSKIEDETETIGIVAYSLGDFLNPLSSSNINGSYILEVLICKDLKTGITDICDYGFIPTYTHVNEKDNAKEYSILPVSQIEKENVLLEMSESQRSDMKLAASGVRYKLGSEINELEYELSNEIVNDVDEILTVTARPLNESKTFSLKESDRQLASSGFLEQESSTGSETGIVYRVQFLTLKSNIPVDTRYYSHLKGYEVVKEDGYYKYLIGSKTNLKDANDLCLDVKRQGHSRAFVVVYKDGIRVKL